METGTIIAIIGAAVGAISGIGALVQQARRDKLNGETSLSSATLALLKPYQDEVLKLREELRQYQALNLEERVERLEKKLRQWMAGARLLHNQIEANGLKPVWTPPKDEEA